MSDAKDPKEKDPKEKFREALERKGSSVRSGPKGGSSRSKIQGGQSAANIPKMFRRKSGSS